MQQPVASPIQGASGTAHAAAGKGDREKFAADELAIVMSHFDIGIIDVIQEFPRGSRKAPKLLISSEQGKFLLKRRARGRDDAYKVAFSHALQLFLASKQFPLPHLIGTRKENNSLLQYKGAVYELFEYIPGQGYPQTLEATFDAGRILALYHKLLHDFASEFHPPTGSYHNQPSVLDGLRRIPALLKTEDEAITAMLRFLWETYEYSAERVEAAGFANWPKQYIHADWHPGNMLFRDNRVVAVIDYDSARLLPRLVDIANGALQFSIIGGDEDVNKWPDHPDESRFKRFIRGYDDVMLISEAEVKAMPWLMVEALIAEAVLPIAVTGQFGRVHGINFLQMVQRKAYWITHNADRLTALIEA